jgi:hypothetical protein
MAVNLIDRMDDAHCRIAGVSIGILRSHGRYLLNLRLTGPVPPHWLRSLHVVLTHVDGYHRYLCRPVWSVIKADHAEAVLEPIHPATLPPLPQDRDGVYTPFVTVRLERNPNRGWDFPNATSVEEALDVLGIRPRTDP